MKTSVRVPQHFKLLSVLSTAALSTAHTLTADPVLNPDNGHWYEVILVPEGISWHAARDAAEASSFNGNLGYLATLTSDAEDLFVVQTGIGSRIRDCVSSHNTGSSFDVFPSFVVTSCIASSHDDCGFIVSHSTIERCTADGYSCPPLGLKSSRAGVPAP